MDRVFSVKIYLDMINEYKKEADSLLRSINDLSEQINSCKSSEAYDTLNSRRYKLYQILWDTAQAAKSLEEYVNNVTARQKKHNTATLFVELPAIKINAQKNRSFVNTTV